MRIGDWENLGEKGTEGVAKISKELMHHTIQQVQKGPAFTTAQPFPGLGIEHLAALIGLLTAIIAKNLQRRGKSE